MEAPDSGKNGLLIVRAGPDGLRTLVASLLELGVAPDVASSDLEEIRRTFLQYGGHDLLVLDPDLDVTLARAAVETLTRVDPQLRVALFGDVLPELEEHVRRIGFHPSSRAAVGAIVKALRDL